MKRIYFENDEEIILTIEAIQKYIITLDDHKFNVYQDEINQLEKLSEKLEQIKGE